MTDNSKIDKIQQRIEELKSQLKQEKAKQVTRQRKVDTRKKILLGAMLMHWVDTGAFDKNQLYEELDKFLVRSSDRALFDLSKKSNGTTNQSTSSQLEFESCEHAQTKTELKELERKLSNRNTFTPVIVNNEDL